jgi:hypothetical protein
LKIVVAEREAAEKPVRDVKPGLKKGAVKTAQPEQIGETA